MDQAIDSNQLQWDQEIGKLNTQQSMLVKTILTNTTPLIVAIFAILLSIIAGILSILSLCKINNQVQPQRPNQLQASLKRLYETHVRFIINFKLVDTYRYTYCGTVPVLKDHKLTLEDISVHLNPLTNVAICPINMSCDCSMLYQLRETPNTGWTQTQLENLTPRSPILKSAPHKNEIEEEITQIILPKNASSAVAYNHKNQTRMDIPNWQPAKIPEPIYPSISFPKWELDAENPLPPANEMDLKDNLESQRLLDTPTKIQRAGSLPRIRKPGLPQLYIQVPY